MTQPGLQLDSSARAALVHLVDLSLKEDHADDDVTSALTVPADGEGVFVVRNRQWGIPAGLEAIAWTFDRLGAKARIELLVADGQLCAGPTQLARIRGPRRAVLAAERTFLNLIGMLSGTATLTRRFADAAGEHCRVLDTRKTWPGYRRLQKYAVICGGGHNHRPHLAGGILLKDNHRHGGLDLPAMVKRARDEYGSLEVVVEVDDRTQLETALTLDVDRILLDNFAPARVREAVRLRDARGRSIGLEVSGGVDLDKVSAYAEAGADFVSVGALTHSAPVWDVGLDEELSAEAAG